MAILWNCNKINDSTKLKKGEEMARAYCSSCHEFPEPTLLTRKIWTNKVLPNMATRMGFKWGFPYKGLDAEEVTKLIKINYFPEHPVISEEMMLRIVKYFENNSIEKPAPQEREAAPDTNFTLFTINELGINKISTQNILLKNFTTEKILLKSYENIGTYLFKNEGMTKISKTIASDGHIFDKKLYLLNIQKTKAYNLPTGNIICYDFITKKENVALDSLIRPVNMDIADLNNDQKPDFVVSEFGDYLGNLSLHISHNQGFTKKILKDYPGACKSKFVDINKDGKLDIVVLMSQGKEELLVYLNNGKNNFIEKSIAKFPPTNGNNNMEVADIDHDGLLDIIMTNGDNADISSQLKNYHGISIFKNLDNNNYKLIWFYPIYGASNLVIADFDQDGIMDIAIISHFPDFRNINYEDFVFFNGIGANKFKPYKFKAPFNGRPLTMEKLDYDQDGDMDIMIGSFIDNLTDPGVENYTTWSKKKIDCWLLENKLTK